MMMVPVRLKSGLLLLCILAAGSLVAYFALPTRRNAKSNAASGEPAEMAVTKPPHPVQPADSPVSPRTAPAASQADALGTLGALAQLKGERKVSAFKEWVKDSQAVRDHFGEAWKVVFGEVSLAARTVMLKALIRSGCSALDGSAQRPILEAALSVDPGQSRNDGIATFLDSTKDPALVLEMIDRLMSSGLDDDAYLLKQRSGFSALSTLDRQRLVGLVNARAAGPGGYPFVSALVDQVSKLKNPVEEMSILTGLDPVARTQSVALFFNTTSQLNPSGALDALVANEKVLDEKEVANAARNVFMNLADADPVMALKQTERLSTPEAASEGRRTVFRRWLHSDSIAASKFVGDLAAGPARDTGIQEIVYLMLSKGDKDSALQWAGQASDQQIKAELASAVGGGK